MELIKRILGIKKKPKKFNIFYMMARDKATIEEHINQDLNKNEVEIVHIFIHRPLESPKSLMAKYEVIVLYKA